MTARKEKPMKRFAVITLLSLAAVGAIADNPHGMPPGIAKKLSHSHCDNCGVVHELKHETRKGEGGAVGIIGGAAVGGLLGNQVGKGNGKTLATVGGAVAGGFAGNEVQKHVTSKDVWITTVMTRDGSLMKFEQDTQPAWKTGSVVKVNGRTLVAHHGS
jgi:outer membrane lipoprotein SlyB